jgi:ABC-type phosphate transport system ATPase subunit
MNDLIEGCSLKGRVLFDGADLYAPEVDPVEVRRRIGMVFQQPNPFPKSIYENIAFGARINGYNGDMDELVERHCVRPQYGMNAKISSKKVEIHCLVVNSSVFALHALSRLSLR